MAFRVASTAHGAFYIIDPATGLGLAGLTLTGTAFKNGVASGATVTMADAGSGRYRWSVPLASFAADDDFYIEASYAIGSNTLYVQSATYEVNPVALTQAATAAQIATYLLTEATSASDFQTAGSLGALIVAGETAAVSADDKLTVGRLAYLDQPATIAVLPNTAQGGNTINTLKLNTQPAVAGGYNGLMLDILTGTGALQSRLIIASALDGTVTVAPNFNQIPASNGTYVLRKGAGAVALLDLLQADRYVDKTTDPAAWALVLVKEGTGTLGVGTELLRQPLYDVDGTALSAVTTAVGRSTGA